MKKQPKFDSRRAETEKLSSPQEIPEHRWRWAIKDSSRLSLKMLYVFCSSKKRNKTSRKTFLLRWNSLINAEPKRFKKGDTGKRSFTFTLARCLPETNLGFSKYSWDRQESNYSRWIFSWIFIQIPGEFPDILKISSVSSAVSDLSHRMRF